MITSSYTFVSISLSSSDLMLHLSNCSLDRVLILRVNFVLSHWSFNDFDIFMLAPFAGRTASLSPVPFSVSTSEYAWVRGPD